MPRVKRGTKRRAKRKKILDRASGYFLTKSKLYRSAKESVERGLNFAYTGRKLKKRDFRSLWIVRIGAAARLNGLNYSQLMHGLKLAGVELDHALDQRARSFDHDIVEAHHLRLVDHSESDARRLASNPPDHLIGADLPLPQRFELREHPRRVDRPAASRKRHHVVNRGIGLDDVDILPQLLRRGLEGDVLGGLDGADQPASVLLGKEPLGNGDVERDVDAHSGDGQRQRQAFVAQHPGKVDFVEMMQRVEPALA